METRANDCSHLPGPATDQDRRPWHQLSGDPSGLANGVSLDFDRYEHIDEHHYAFQLSEKEFEAAFARIRDRGITYYADPGCRQPGQVYTSGNGRRGTYFRDPDGHLMEILTPIPDERGTS